MRDNIATFGGDPEERHDLRGKRRRACRGDLLAVPDAKGLFRQAISESPASGLVSTGETAAGDRRKFADALGVDGADDLMRTRPADLVTTLDLLLESAACTRWTVPSPSARPTETTSSRWDPIEAMRTGRRTRFRSSWGTNADEGKLFNRFHEAAADHRARHRETARVRRTRDP